MTKYVFHARDAIRYRFPTHTNDLIMDRKDATTSEAFFVILEPGESPPLHVHPDAEQVFFILEGEAEMTVGRESQETVLLRVGDFVRTPPGTWHAVRCTGPGRFVYLSIDCFAGGPTEQEPTWDRHVRVMCAENGWDFEAVRLGPVPDDSPSAVAALTAAPGGR
jgi:mannose-6-phosphate isomerase-like protein (cupin superfamily)